MASLYGSMTIPTLFAITAAIAIGRRHCDGGAAEANGAVDVGGEVARSGLRRKWCNLTDAPWSTRFAEERRHGRRRGNLKGRSTDRAPTICPEWIRRISCVALPLGETPGGPESEKPPFFMSRGQKRPIVSGAQRTG